MGNSSDLFIFAWVALLIVLVLGFYAFVGVRVVQGIRSLILFVRNGPQNYRMRVESDARLGHREPAWRAPVQVLLIGATVCLLAFGVWKQVADRLPQLAY